MWGNSTYIILILVWAGPVIAIQWLIGAHLLIHRWKVLLPGILVPTLYLTFIDSFALRSGTWTISPLQSLNIFLPVIGVPIEEAVFFLVTNTLIIQGIILFLERSRVIARVRQILSVGKRLLEMGYKLRFLVRGPDRLIARGSATPNSTEQE